VISPGLVDTPMSRRAMGDPEIVDFVRAKQPLDGGRPGCPGDLDEAVIFFLSDASGFVTGQVLAVDGGWTVTDAAAPR
jgi:NAD(P)-dependent dehydrogenase (short-subunit alcohol dehydrogenase family)